MPRRRPAKAAAERSTSTEDGSDASAEVVPTESPAPAEADTETTVSRPPGGYRITRDGEPVQCGGWVQTANGWALIPTE